MKIKGYYNKPNVILISGNMDIKYCPTCRRKLQLMSGGGKAKGKSRTMIITKFYLCQPCDLEVQTKSELKI